MFIEMPKFHETSPALKNFWLRACNSPFMTSQNSFLLQFLTNTGKYLGQLGVNSNSLPLVPLIFKRINR